MSMQSAMMPEPRRHESVIRKGKEAIHSPSELPPEGGEPPHGPGGGYGGGGFQGGPESRSVQAFMRQMTRNLPTFPWEQTELILDLGGTTSIVESFADLFWSIFISSALVIEAVGRRAGPSREALERASYFVVGYRSGKHLRRDLLVFVPEEMESNLAVRVNLTRKWGELFEVLNESRFKNRGGNPAINYILEVMMKWPSSIAESRFRAFLSSTAPAVVVMPEPPLELHAGVASPLQPVGLIHSAGYNSTAGVTARNADGVEGVTVAYHALKDGNVCGFAGQQIKVGGSVGTVVSVDPISDSAFVRIEDDMGDLAIKDLKPPRQSPGPGYGQQATFEGLGSCAKKTTTVVGSSPTVVLRNAALQRYIMTNPDTIPKDSGCALIDPAGELLGFCFAGAGTASPFPFSIWIWADSVFQAHRLE